MRALNGFYGGEKNDVNLRAHWRLGDIRSWAGLKTEPISYNVNHTIFTSDTTTLVGYFYYIPPNTQRFVLIVIYLHFVFSKVLEISRIIKPTKYLKIVNHFSVSRICKTSLIREKHWIYFECTQNFALSRECIQWLWISLHEVISSTAQRKFIHFIKY